MSRAREQLAPLIRTVLRRPPGSSFRPAPEDVMLISYPRSGNTWMRFVLGNLMFADSTDFLNLEERVPSIYVSSARHISRLPVPRLIKSHERFSPTYRKAVYLVRDPRDVAASYLRYLQRVGAQERHVTLTMFVESFLTGLGSGYWWGSWGDHVAGWLTRRGDSDFLLVRYEDLLSSPEVEVGRVAQFCGLPTDASAVARAIMNAAPGKMRKLEEAQTGAAWNDVSINSSDSSLPFVGPAREGTGRAMMDADTLHRFDSALGPLMNELGYS